MKQLVFFSILLPALVLSQGQTKLDESFDPTSLSDWPGSKVRIERIRSLQEHLAGLSGMADSVGVVEYTDYVFWVQLGSTSDYDEAAALEARAAQTFDSEILVQFDSPYYKIRVGKLNNREEAQKLQQYAIKKGYRRAWVVRTENLPTQAK